MKKVLLAISVLMFVLPSARALAQAEAQPYRTEVCVNASDADYAKRLFPNASFHVIPNSADPLMNGWRIVSGPVGAGGKIMTDAQEIQLRRQEYNNDWRSE